MSVAVDEIWMRRALDEARKGVGRTSPNPPVGAVIVRDGIELGSGWHRAAGRPHAEREAIADVRASHGDEALRGATIYITLEPCSTHGRTPPCTDGLIEAGIRRVVYAIPDPDPRHAGRAEEMLRAHGLEVRSSLLEPEANRLIAPFRKVRREGLPWVIFKTAMSLDGRISRPPGEGMWLSGPEARAEVQRLRAECEAILTSGETVRRDRPRLDLRDPDLLADRDQPWRMILTDRPESLPADAPLLSDGHRERTLIGPRGNPASALRRLVTECGVSTVLLECGGRLAGELFDLGLIDELVVFLAPMITAGDIPAVGGGGFPEGLRLDEPSFRRFGPDVMMRGIIRR